MSRWHQDDVDIACEAWAYQWVYHMARAPDRAGRSIGPMGCTLGRVHELHDGAASNTEHDRHFPEVFMGQGLAVTRTLQAMSESSRIIVWAHYVGRVYDQQTWERLKHPLQQRFIADRLGLSLPEYYRRRDVAKQCIRVGLYMDTKPLAIERGFGVLVRQA